MRKFSRRQLCILALTTTPGVGTATINLLLSRSDERNTSLAECIDELRTEGKARSSIPSSAHRRITQMGDPIARGKRVVHNLRHSEVKPLFVDDELYPARISAHLDGPPPPVLFLRGNEQLLGRNTVGIVGSRKPSAPSRHAAVTFAEALATAGTVVVSGGARGIDSAGHTGGLRGRGTIIIPATGVLRFQWKHIDKPRHAGWCILGHFPPGDRWRTRNALQRNHSIVALSDAVVGFEPRNSGGTWRSCHSAIKQRKPLFIVNSRTDKEYLQAQEHFVREGAMALDPHNMPGHEDFFAMVRNYSPPPASSQSELFGSR
ncbi:MAG: DNA-processing protein DprA [Planctomycetota bacterium]